MSDHESIQWGLLNLDHLRQLLDLNCESLKNSDSFILDFIQTSIWTSLCLIYQKDGRKRPVDQLVSTELFICCELVLDLRCSSDSKQAAKTAGWNKELEWWSNSLVGIKIFRREDKSVRMEQWMSHEHNFTVVTCQSSWWTADHLESALQNSTVDLWSVSRQDRPESEEWEWVNDWVNVFQVHWHWVVKQRNHCNIGLLH